MLGTKRLRSPWRETSKERYGQVTAEAITIQYRCQAVNHLKKGIRALLSSDQCFRIKTKPEQKGQAKSPCL